MSDSAKLEFIWAGWSAPNNIKALTSSRNGGVSKVPYDAFNLGAHVDDDIECVNRNRTLLREVLSLPSEPVWLEQTHSTDILILGAQPMGDGLRTNDTLCADGAFTLSKGVVCAIMTADCMPLFLTDKAGSKVALLHVGWRGLADGIIEKGVAIFDQPANELIAYAGPTISFASFEIGAEVKAKLGGSESCYRESRREKHHYADLYALAGERLKNVGVTNYSFSSHCTFEDKDEFYSYRRDGTTGRMASLIWIDM